MRLTLAITTYERPEALAAVLDSVARQHGAPDQIVVADDGSGPATQAVIDAFVKRSAAPVTRVSQPHEGFRAARLRNLAIAAARHEYLVFIDGDMLLHPLFIADHRRAARVGCFIQGVRAHADASLTRRLLAQPCPFPSPATAGLGGLRRAYLLHSTAMAGLCARLGNGLVAIKSCNQGFWRADLERVNGFNEDFIGWGPEDKELCARLAHAGVRRRTLLFGGIACHLHHGAAARERLAANLALLAETRTTGRVRAARGLDAHSAD